MLTTSLLAPPAPADVPSCRAGDPRARLLTELRGDVARRPPVDPGLAGGLRAWLEDGVAGLRGPGEGGDLREPVLVSPAALTASTDHHVGGAGGGPVGREVAAALGPLLRVLFRQWVVCGTMGDPTTDALTALHCTGGLGSTGGEGTADLVEGLDPADRLRLDEELACRASLLRSRWPVLPPAWFPRTLERISVPLAGGRVELRASADLLVGAPPAAASSVCVVTVSPGPVRRRDREASQYLALLETLRSGAKPCRLAVYDALSGRLYAQAVTDELLGATVCQVIDAAARVAGRTRTGGWRA